MAIIKPEQLSSGLYSISGSFSGSFQGDGSQLSGIVSSKWSGSNPITRDGNVEITGSLNVTGGVTASLFGTASWAENAQTASYAPNFANTNLTFTGDRAHNTDGNDFQITTDNGAFGESFIYMSPLLNEIGTANAYTDYTTRIDHQINPVGTIQRISTSGVSIGMGSVDSLARLHVRGSGATSATTTLLIDNVNSTASLTVLDNGSVGIGAAPSESIRLDIRAQGTGTTPEFRIRNSANNNNFITIAGNGNITVGSSTAIPSSSTLRVFSGFGGGNFLNLINDSTSFGVYHGIDMTSTGRPGYFALETADNQGSSITRFRGGGSTGANAKITAFINHPGDTDLTGHWHFRTQVHLGNAYRNFNTNLGRHTLLIETGSAPTTSSANSFITYASASSIGNAAPHFLTENGSIIKLYQQSAVTSSQGLADVLTNLGFLTGSSTIVTLPPFPYTGSAQITGSLGVTGSTTLQTTGAGTLTVQGSGSSQPLLLVTGSVGELLSVTDQDDPNEPLLVVSGSAGQLLVVENSTTGSLLQIYDSNSNSVFEVNNDAEIVYGISSSIFATQYNVINVTESYQTIYNIETGSYTGVFINYTLTSGSNATAGQLLSVWNNGTSSFSEITSTDIGDTSQIAFDVTMTGSIAQVAVSASLTTGWQVKTALNIL